MLPSECRRAIAPALQNGSAITRGGFVEGLWLCKNRRREDIVFSSGRALYFTCKKGVSNGTSRFHRSDRSRSYLSCIGGLRAGTHSFTKRRKQEHVRDWDSARFPKPE